MKQNRGELERAHYNGLTTADKGALLKAKECGGSTYSRWATIGDKWVRELTVNIDLALAQIAEMESSEKPLTWNERINQMTVEEKATLFQHDDCFIYKLTGTAYCDRHLGCEECTKQFLNSPYTEGATK